MLSEWLVDKPEDFESNWLAVVVPIGRRCLIVAARKTTHAYSRVGAELKSFPSLLPGGCRLSHRLAQDYCILDCIFHEGKQMFYILDVMCWGGYPVYDSDTEFRVFWKEQKCKELEKISAYSRVNPLPFENLPFHACTKEGLERVLAEPPPFQVDGLLFIHKECRYILGTSPLAAWLKPHMIPDILGIAVSAEFLAQSPAMSGTPKKAKEGRMDTGEADRSSRGSRQGKKMDTEKGREGDMKEKQSELEPASSTKPPPLDMET
jgi:snurportin-1